MGLSDYGIVQPPYVSLTTNSQIFGFTPRGQIACGTVDAVNVYNNMVSPGDVMLFRKTNAMILLAYGTQYWLVDENELIYKENVVM
jgi:hypothetical protein